MKQVTVLIALCPFLSVNCVADSTESAALPCKTLTPKQVDGLIKNIRELSKN